jgi:hypothetical protein
VSVLAARRPSSDDAGCVCFARPPLPPPPFLLLPLCPCSFDGIVFCVRIGPWEEGAASPTGLGMTVLGRSGTLAVETAAAILTANVSPRLCRPFPEAVMSEVAGLTAKAGAASPLHRTPAPMAGPATRVRMSSVCIC